MRNIAGRQAALDFDLIEVFDGVAGPVSHPALGDITAGVGHGFAPRVVNIEAHSAREPLPQRCLPGVEIRLLRIVVVRALDVARVWTKAGHTVDPVECPDHDELDAARSHECALQYQ